MPSPYPGRSMTVISLATFATGERSIIGMGEWWWPSASDGGTFPMELRSGEVHRAKGHRLFTGFIRDLTERQQTRRRA